MGIGATLLLTIPANAIVYARFGIANVATLPVGAGVALVPISTGLTFLGWTYSVLGRVPKDPVEALRSE